jgi:hypothetical protein
MQRKERLAFNCNCEVCACMKLEAALGVNYSVGSEQ